MTSRPKVPPKPPSLRVSMSPGHTTKPGADSTLCDIQEASVPKSDPEVDHSNSVITAEPNDYVDQKRAINVKGLTRIFEGQAYLRTGSEGYAAVLRANRKQNNRKLSPEPATETDPLEKSPKDSVISVTSDGGSTIWTDSAFGDASSSCDEDFDVKSNNTHSSGDPSGSSDGQKLYHPVRQLKKSQSTLVLALARFVEHLPAFAQKHHRSIFEIEPIADLLRSLSEDLSTYLSVSRELNEQMGRVEINPPHCPFVSQIFTPPLISKLKEAMTTYLIDKSRLENLLNLCFDLDDFRHLMAEFESRHPPPSNSMANDVRLLLGLVHKRLFDIKFLLREYLDNVVERHGDEWTREIEGVEASIANMECATTEINALPELQAERSLAADALAEAGPLCGIVREEMSRYFSGPPIKTTARTGPLQKESRKRNQPRDLVLFRHKLLYCYRNALEQPIVKLRIGMRDIFCVRPHPDNPAAFCVYSKERSLTFEAQDKQECASWIEAFNSVIQQQITQEEQLCPGDVAPAWLPDTKVTMCQVCRSPFSFTNRRHHCRICGRVICNECSARAPVPYKKFDVDRVCPDCYRKLFERATTCPQSDVNGQRLQGLLALFQPVDGHAGGQDPHSPTDQPALIVSGRLEMWRGTTWKMVWAVIPQSGAGGVLQLYKARAATLIASGRLEMWRGTTWKMVWAVIPQSGAGGVLQLYKARADPKPFATLILLSYDIYDDQRVDPSGVLIILEHRNQVTGTAHMYRFRTDSVNAMKWITAMEQAKEAFGPTL